MLLEGKRGLVLGIANKRSIAWGIAQAAHREGARLAVTYQGERRWRIEGGCYFFTLVTRERRQWLRTLGAIAALREGFRAELRARPFTIEAIVILPDHLHSIWTLPEGDADFSTRWRRIKGRVTRQLGEPADGSGLWQPRFWEHAIRDEADLRAHLDYVHFNPVRHGLVASPALWPHSSFHRHVRLGTYPAAWAADPGAIASE